jgi:tetratricopeptide (TPR) repeat protein
MIKSKRVLLSITILMLLFLRVAIPIIPAYSDFISTDTPKYKVNQTVTLTGNGAPSTGGTIKVMYEATTVLEGTISTNATGKFQFEFNLANDTTLGDYRVIVVINDVTSITNFIVVSDDEVLCDNLMTLTENSKTQALELLSAYAAKDEDDTQNLDNKLSTANAAYEKAQNLIEEKNFRDAISKLHQALSLYGEVISEIQDDEELEDEATFNYALTSIQLHEKIDRLLSKADSLEQRAQYLSNDGINVDEALSLIDSSRNKLSEAQSFLADNVEEASQNIEDAIRMLDEAFDIIKSANKINTVELAQMFVDKAQIRAQKLEQQITHLMEDANASKTAINAVESAFHRIYEHINQIKGRISSDNLDEMLNEVENNTDDIDDTYKHIGNNEEKELLRDIQKLEAKIDITNSTLQKLSERGINTTNILDTLKNTRQKLEDAKAALRTNISAAKNLVEQVDDELDGINHSINNHMINNPSNLREYTKDHNHANKSDKEESSGSSDEEPE